MKCIKRYYAAELDGALNGWGFVLFRYGREQRSGCFYFRNTLCQLDDMKGLSCAPNRKYCMEMLLESIDKGKKTQVKERGNDGRQ